MPIWVDEIEKPDEWSSEFLKPEAKEVLQVLGAFIVCFRRPVDENAFVFAAMYPLNHLFTANSICRKTSEPH